MINSTSQETRENVCQHRWSRHEGPNRKRSKILRIFSWIVDVSGFSSASISHQKFFYSLQTARKMSFSSFSNKQKIYLWIFSTTMMIIAKFFLCVDRLKIDFLRNSTSYLRWKSFFFDSTCSTTHMLDAIMKIEETFEEEESVSV